MRSGIPQWAVLTVCAALLSACAGAPSHEEIQATFDAGLKVYDAGDYKAAYKTWSGIEEFDLAALRNTALMLRKGQGVDKDPKAALQKMARAADLGLVTAQADLGDMLINGEAGPPDVPDAIPWLARAADGGHPLAAMSLAKIYDEGKDVPRDLAKACPLYQQAADARVDGAAARLTAVCPAPATPSSTAASAHH